MAARVDRKVLYGIESERKRWVRTGQCRPVALKCAHYVAVVVIRWKTINECV